MMLRFRGSIFLTFGVLDLVLLQCFAHGSSSSTTSDKINNNNGNPRRSNGAMLINGLWNSMMIRGPATPSAPSKCINSAEASHCPLGRKQIHKDLDHNNIP